MTEQRRNQRFDLHLPIELLSGSKTKGETKNMSSCGVLFSTPVPIDVGSPIEYMITLPNASGTRVDVRLRCLGTVVRADEDANFAATLERYEFVRA
ncbi:MAG: PilZ domain-containing protein [Bryobacteraceae bacterium]